MENFSFTDVGDSNNEKHLNEPEPKRRKIDSKISMN